MNIGEHKERVAMAMRWIEPHLGTLTEDSKQYVRYSIDTAMADAYFAGERDGERRADRLAAPGVK